ncbi:GTPase-activator protein for Ras-like GTPase [Colletotrichum truncatum]|uniref:GTPase-activator protein for Ras-like GTPase n=1 Tax=Colletotrichum truncatum TaxID=5467 RepID=A0ACC3Z9R2_COLTU
MNGDAGLVGCLVDRLATRLPHRTGTHGQELQQDDVVLITRATLVKISTTAAAFVLDALIALLEDIVRNYKGLPPPTHPPHVLLSEIYVITLAADCCTAHWEHIKCQSLRQNSSESESRRNPLKHVPEPLKEALVNRIFDLFKWLIEPIPEGYVLPSSTILDDTPRPADPISGSTDGFTSSLFGGTNGPQDEVFSAAHLTVMEPCIRVVVEYVTASTWSYSFDYFRNVVYTVRTAAVVQAAPGQSATAPEDDKAALSVLKILSFFWVDAQKLGLIIQEICSSFLHFRKTFQNTVAVVAPLLITRWLERYPHEFVQQHTLHRRLDGGADTLFDMTQTVVDNGRKKGVLYPLQTTLLFLLPDVFEVASNLREAKSGSMAKKVGFLDGLRKALRNKNEQAAYSLVSLLRAARHFDAEDDAALVSYAMDVQDEVREAVFRRGGNDASLLDQDLMTAAFVSLAQLSPDSCVDSLQSYLSPSSPQGFKTAVVQGCRYFARQNDSHIYEQLFTVAGPYMRTQLKAVADLPTETSAVVLSMPRRDSNLHSSTNMTCDVLKFLDASPHSLFGDNGSGESVAPATEEDVFLSFLSCVVSVNPTVRRLATGVAKRLFFDKSILEVLRTRSKLTSPALKGEFWRRSSLVLLNMCNQVTSDGDGPEVKAIHEYLEARKFVIASLRELSELPDDVPELEAASSRLETTLLVSLCSADVETCQTVTSCIRIFFEENNLVDITSDAAKTFATLLRNGDVYGEIASRAFRFTGLVAFQKRVRGLLRQLQYPTSGILSAWEYGFERWLLLSREVSMAPIDAIDERTLTEWRNYSGFLASLGGICTANQAIILEEPAINGLKWIDRLPSENYEEPLLSRYLKLSIQLLGCASVRIREATREVLSSEVSSTLYQSLFKALESELEVLFTGALAPSDKAQDVEIIFAEQAISLLKALVERLESPSDLGAASSIHLGALALNFAKFLDGVNDSNNTLRVKIKVCQLCEAVTKRKEHLNLRDDVRIRNQLLEYIFGWIARPRSPRLDSTSSTNGRPDETTRVQKDLDRACLKSLAELTFRLPLQPGEGQTDAGMSELKSQMFHTYFNRFLSLLNHESPENGRNEHLTGMASRDEGTPSSELAITILSNLLSANIDVGLKHSLNIGYHDNVEIRTAFVKVLYNILIQGTEFSNLTDAAVSEKYDELLELLTKDMTLVAAMSAVCPSSEVDELTISLLNIFEHRGLSFDLLETLIKQEIEETDNESELLRRTCVATKMLSVYAKWKGQPYLKATLQKVVERLMLTSKDLDLELDPARVSSTDELQKNALQLRIVAKVFIDDICASSSSMPTSFRKICNIISAAVLPRFQEAKYTAVGAFVFLRFFCPAIVAPEVEGLVTTAPSKEMRRGLLLIAKVIQNLANNVLFGAKEPYMFPLNDFLTQNIYRVTTFLREISVAPESIDCPPSIESFDFGSCVALHRFLYDHWDHMRQRLVTQERKDYVRSPAEVSRGRSPVLEPLRNLITNLGPPPLAVTWNRPQISTNTPPSYSRFQNFMLRNAFRSAESFVTARAVYDGGESKDSLSIICIILRHIDAESIDYDTLLYCYLKIASRLWHKPFGLLIDATCYNGQNEPQDELFKKLELLTPVELSKNLVRIYVYNMNSAFRKCFRRLLRLSAKSETSVFNPKNVDYHLIGSLQDLQAHFHLSQLHLPKETISVVTDTRYVFQPITRLSKTKGKIEVVIKVGSQFVQVTTTKKQEVFPGYRLSTTVNDIFRLGEVEEAPTSIQTEDDSAFGLRADNGKIVMYFTSPKKADVLQTIRGAKAKYGKDTRAHKAYERLIRPQDVPGTLLNLALTNLSSSDHVLRLSSYNLLGALCKAFKFSAASNLMCTKDLSVPMDPSHFVIRISKQLAMSEPQLTFDFLTEFFVGWETFTEEQKPLSLAYMAPWLPGLRTAVLVNEADAEKGKEKIAVLFRKLIDIAMTDHSLTFILEQTVWPAIYQDEPILDVFLEEVMRAALSFGFSEEPMEALSSIVSGMGSITLRGKVISRLRKALNRSSLRPTRYLPDNAVWAEICVLLHFCLSLSFDNGVQSQLYLPEIFHVVTILANTGSPEVRLLVHRLLINTVHAACTSFNLDDTRFNKLRGSLDFLSEPKSEVFSTPPPFLRDGASMSTTQDSGPSLAATENLAALLFEVCSVAAPSVDISNAWRSRWMSLVASTAFQNNPAIQPRAFAVMGCLAREEVDDDLLYQVLVALRNSVGRLGEDTNSDMLISIVTSLSKMMAKLPSASRYGLQLFWLAVSLLRLVPPALFNCTAQFLEAVMTNISTVGDLRGDKMGSLLLQGRVQLEDAALPLDEAYGIHFTHDNFHFAVCACLARGLADTTTKINAMRVLSAFLDMAGNSAGDPGNPSGDISRSPYMALILARTVGSEELKDSLWLAGINPSVLGDMTSTRRYRDLDGMKDKDLLLNTAIELIDFQYLEDGLQNRTLRWLTELASARPAVIMHLCGPIVSILDEVLLHCQNSSTLECAQTLLYTLTSNPKFSSALESSNVLNDILEDMGFGGLWRSCSFNFTQDQDRKCFILTEKLIEVN